MDDSTTCELGAVAKTLFHSEPGRRLSAEEIVKSYSSLTAAGLQAALAYPADLARQRVLPLPP